MAGALWSGRFQKATDAAVWAMNSSLSFDKRLYAHDIAGSIAHATMLAQIGILTPAELEAITAGLTGIKTDIDSGALVIGGAAEDIHMFVEEELTKRIGDPGKKLHTARSRNDQVATDLKLWMRDELGEIDSLIQHLVAVFIEVAQRHVDTVMPGYTHLQRAQPITLAHHLMAYVHMFMRDLQRLGEAKKRLNYSPLGAAALATTTYPVDRELTAKLLGFDGVATNSLDAVSDRDYVMEIASDLAIFMVHLSRCSEEIILWASAEYGFIELDDAYATGSSIMPQKKNPDVAELTRGKTGRVIGDVMTLLTMMKNLPLAYNKDVQEDKEAIFDAVDTVKLCIPAFAGMVATMRVNAGQMRRAAGGGFTNATDLADYLVIKGVPFRQAHEITGKLVHHCVAESICLEELGLEVLREHCELIEDDVYDYLDIANCVARRDVVGGPARQAVLCDVVEVKEWLESRSGVR
ncbi:argininosuccinate lyase [Arcanobacterium phocae]|uniref:argininosuccinate lyase n=1 Tax=Arcanobacterium phocae TaxID=131112 RepID=UPI001C0F28B5|nr:argininosuccinate lyase [Arcanobacterium phocae]